MIFTARQLEQLHKTNGHIVLPYRARLSPLAADWVKSRRLQIGYGPEELVEQATRTAETVAAIVQDQKANGTYLWWCDGPCGPAKAAVVGLEREATLKAASAATDASQTVAAVKEIAGAIAGGSAVGAILLVQTAAAAVVFANRCPNLRAIVGTSLDAVEQGIGRLAANVMIVEHPRATLMQVRNMALRFLRAPRCLSDDVKRRLQELSTCA